MWSHPGGYSGFQVTGMKDFLGFEIFDFRIFWGRKILASIFFGKLDLSRDFFGYSKLMFLFFMLYHLMLSGNFSGSQIWHGDFFGVKFWSRDSFWGLLKPQGIFSGFDFCPHSIIPVT